MEDLEKNYNLVSKKTSELHKACEQLVIEQNQLQCLVQKINEILYYFNQFTTILKKLSSKDIIIQDKTFENLLDKLDQSIEFLSNHVNKNNNIIFIKFSFFS